MMLNIGDVQDQDTGRVTCPRTQNKEPTGADQTTPYPTCKHKLILLRAPTNWTPRSRGSLRAATRPGLLGLLARPELQAEAVFLGPPTTATSHRRNRRSANLSIRRFYASNIPRSTPLRSPLMGDPLSTRARRRGRNYRRDSRACCMPPPLYKPPSQRGQVLGTKLIIPPLPPKPIEIHTQQKVIVRIHREIDGRQHLTETRKGPPSEGNPLIAHVANIRRKIKKGVPMQRSENLRKLRAAAKAFATSEKSEEKVSRNKNKVQRVQSAKSLYD